MRPSGFCSFVIIQKVICLAVFLSFVFLSLSSLSHTNLFWSHLGLTSYFSAQHPEGRHLISLSCLEFEELNFRA